MEAAARKWTEKEIRNLSCKLKTLHEKLFNAADQVQFYCLESIEIPVNGFVEGIAISSMAKWVDMVEHRVGLASDASRQRFASSIPSSKEDTR